MAFVLPSRQVHLDFHTGPGIRDVGSAFDARQFAKTFREAHVNSVTVFAKCHHGHLYYLTDHAARHPGLKPGLGLLEQQVEALHAEGIRAPIYISVLCDEFAANTHPEWIAVKADGAHVGARLFEAGWQIMDLSSPYQDFLAAQTREVLAKFHPVDGIFFDMCWDQPSCNKYAVDAMVRRGLDPKVEGDRKVFAHEVALGFMKRFREIVRAAAPEATCYFNARPLANLAEEIGYMTQVEIEALATGGWGYGYFPKNVRLARTFDKPYLGMTARFHKSWADFGGIKPDAALEYETSLMMAHGAKISIGDQLHPRGTLDEAAYELIGRAMGRAEAREPWLENARPLSQIGLFQVPTAEYHVQATADDGAVRMLTQLKYPFDLVRRDSEWSGYELLILPDVIAVDAAMAEKLGAYLRGGGKILASAGSGLNADATACVLPELGIVPHGLSPFTTHYIRVGDSIAADIAATDHVMYDRPVQVTAAPGARVAARNVDPYFERAWDHFSSHFQTPPDKLSGYAGAVVTANTGYIAAPIFGAYARHGNAPYRLLVRNLIRLLVPEPLVTLENAKLATEVSLMEQPGRIIAHLLHYVPERRTATLDMIEDVVALADIGISLRMGKPPTEVYLAPERTQLAWRHEKGRLNVRLPELCGHAMIVVETAG